MAHTIFTAVSVLARYGLDATPQTIEYAREGANIVSEYKSRHGDWPRWGQTLDVLFMDFVQIQLAAEWLVDRLVVTDDEVWVRGQRGGDSSSLGLCGIRGCPRPRRAGEKYCRHHGAVAVWEAPPRIYPGEVLWEGR